MSRRALLLAGGQAPPPKFLQAVHRPGDLVVAADSGLNLALAAGIPTDVVVGDLDSLQPGLERGFEVQRHPRGKDASDLELALEEAYRRGAREALVLGALGGRLDHTLFNVVSLLEKALEMGFQATLLAPGQEIFAAAPGVHEVLDRQGWHCSILPVDARACLSLEGMEYPLQAEWLRRASTRGLSNRVVSPLARVEVLEGRVLVLLAEDQDPPEAGRSRTSCTVSRTFSAEKGLRMKPSAPASRARLM